MTFEIRGDNIPDPMSRHQSIDRTAHYLRDQSSGESSVICTAQPTLTMAIILAAPWLSAEEMGAAHLALSIAAVCCLFWLYTARRRGSKSDEPVFAVILG